MPPSPPSTNRRVVVVEDDPVLASLIRELLTTEGYQVFVHGRAADAHLLVRNVRPRVVLLDLRLAEDAGLAESGWQVLDRLVLDPATRDIPVILASGAVESIEAHRPALLPQHGVRVLLKPYDLDRLVAALDEIAEPRGAVLRQDGPAPGAACLTRRQREIAHLIAQGCTNRTIAARLVLEPGTVANHVANILDRLGLANRAQVAAWAARIGLAEERAAAEGSRVA
jgi:DNA-binding NarL/FixJ family response regulator